MFSSIYENAKYIAGRGRRLGAAGLNNGGCKRIHVSTLRKREEEKHNRLAHSSGFRDSGYGNV